MNKAKLTGLGLIMPVALAACSPEARNEAPAASPGMPETSTPESVSAAAPGPITGTGEVLAVDVAAGTVMLDHGPIPALNWGRMSMEFKAADPAILEGVQTGDTITFEIKSASESTIITTVE